MTSIAETFAQAGFPLGFLMFGIYLIYKSRSTQTKKYLILSIGLVVVFFGGYLAFQGLTITQESSGDCSSNQIISIGNTSECK